MQQMYHSVTLSGVKGHNLSQHMTAFIIMDLLKGRCNIRDVSKTASMCTATFFESTLNVSAQCVLKSSEKLLLFFSNVNDLFVFSLK